MRDRIHGRCHTSEPAGVSMSNAPTRDRSRHDQRAPASPRPRSPAPTARLVKLAARRMLGQVPDSVGVLWHHQAVMKDAMGIGRKVEGWHELAPRPRVLRRDGVGRDDRLQLLPRPQLLPGAQPRTRRGQGPRGAALARVVGVHPARAPGHGVRGRREPDAAGGDRRALGRAPGRARTGRARRAGRPRGVHEHVGTDEHRARHPLRAVRRVVRAAAARRAGRLSASAA